MAPQPKRRRRTSGALRWLSTTVLFSSVVHRGQSFVTIGQISRACIARKTCGGVRALRMGALPPDDSPYSQPEEEKPFWGQDYVPRVGHPGTMPPGTMKEDRPIEDLPGVNRIPYPHFQEWPWHYRFPAWQPRRLNFVEWMTQKGLMVEDDGDDTGVRYLGRRRRLRAQQAESERLSREAEGLTDEERILVSLGLEGDYFKSMGELVEPEQYLFEMAKSKRTRTPYIVKVREERAAREEEQAAAQAEI